MPQRISETDLEIAIARFLTWLRSDMYVAFVCATEVLHIVAVKFLQFNVELYNYYDSVALG